MFPDIFPQSAIIYGHHVPTGSAIASLLLRSDSGQPQIAQRTQQFFTEARRYAENRIVATPTHFFGELVSSFGL